MGTKVCGEHLHASLEISEHRVAISNYNEVPEAVCQKPELLGCHGAGQHAFDPLKLSKQRANADFVF